MIKILFFNEFIISRKSNFIKVKFFNIFYSYLHKNITNENIQINKELFLIKDSYKNIDNFFTLLKNNYFQINNLNNQSFSITNLSYSNNNNNNININNTKNKIFNIKKIKDKEAEKKREIEYKNNIQNRRYSKYRGVFKNGNKWQALIMINRKKMYIGNYESEEEAAKVYDEYALKYHGNKAKTNFNHEGNLN